MNPEELKETGKRRVRKGVAKGTRQSLRKTGERSAAGVVGELASDLTLGLYKRPRR